MAYSEAQTFSSRLLSGGGRCFYAGKKYEGELF